MNKHYTEGAIAMLKLISQGEGWEESENHYYNHFFGKQNGKTTVKWGFIEAINVCGYTCTCGHYDHEYYCFCPKCKKEITTLAR